MIFILYIATAPNGKKYVGCTGRTLRERRRDHRYIVPREWPGEEEADFADAVKLYGPDAITFEHVASAVGPDSALKTEMALIAQYGTRRPHGYNRNGGGPVKGAGKAA